MRKGIDIFELYEDLKKYLGDKYDNAFYEASEGSAQYDILIEMLETLVKELAF